MTKRKRHSKSRKDTHDWPDHSAKPHHHHHHDNHHDHEKHHAGCGVRHQDYPGSHQQHDLNNNEPNCEDGDHHVTNHHHHHQSSHHQHHRHPHHHKHKQLPDRNWKSSRLLRWGMRSFFVCCLAYMFHHPIPDGIEDPFKYQIFLGGVKIFKHATQACHLVGLDHRMCIRMLVSHLELFTPPADWDVRVEDEYFDGVAVRVYQPIRNARRSDGALIFFHGGGFIVGSPKSYDAMSSVICRELDIVVVSVDYRLAPDHPSPTPLQDCQNATAYFFTHAHKWGVNPDKIGIAGDSAGGNLAAALTLKFRDTGSKHNFLFLVMIYPLLQAMDLTLPSYQMNHWHAIPYIQNDHVASMVLSYLNKDQKLAPQILAHNHTSAQTKAWCKQYIHWTLIHEDLIPDNFQPPPNHHGDDHVINDLESDLLDPYNFPLMAPSLKHFPQTYVMVAEYDTLRDDGLLFARRLRSEGVPVTLDIFPSGWHGMLSFSGGPYIATMNTGKKALSNFTGYMQPHFYPDYPNSEI